VNAEEDASVTYSVKELLSEIRDDVKDVKRDLANKVDKVDFVKLEGRVSVLEQFKWRLAGGGVVAVTIASYVARELLG
jgi:ABC-type dipeptide/oligopeptide/nickel transport system ATPase component